MFISELLQRFRKLIIAFIFLPSETNYINMSLLIRPAIATDMDAVLKLITELAVFEKEPDAVDISKETLVKYGLGENPLFHCFVAEKNSKIIGMALVYFRFSTWKGRSLHLEDLIVSETYRGTGAGKALYNEVMKFGHKNSVGRVEWVVLDWNKNAIEFYQKSGATLLKDWYLAQMDKDKLATYVAGLKTKP